MQPTEVKSPSATPAHHPPPTAPGPAPLQKSVLVCSAGKRVLWPPHPRHGLSQPVKTLLSWLKANLILQTSAALGLFHNGQACWERLPGRGGGRVCVCGCGRVHACARACMGSVCARVRGTAPVASAPLCACAHLRFAWTRVEGGPGQLDRSSAQTRDRGLSGTASSQAKSCSSRSQRAKPWCKAPKCYCRPSDCHGDVKPSTIWGSDGWFLVLCLEKQ